METTPRDKQNTHELDVSKLVKIDPGLDSSTSCVIEKLEVLQGPECNEAFLDNDLM